MDNPLKKFFPVEDRNDGVYLTVARDKKDAVSIAQIRTELDKAFITNYNLEKIQEVLNHARGAFEKIGPPFEYYDVELDGYVDVTVSPLKASMVVHSTAIDKLIVVTATSLAFCLRRKGILCGVKYDVLANMVKNGWYNQEITIAEGTPPVNGENAKLVYEVDLEKAAKPQAENGGKVDYRDIHSIVQVAQNQVIARKEPAGAGKPGTDVTGKDIPPVPGADIVIRGGKNTAVSPDGRSLKAEKSGYLYKQGDLICVGESLVIKKDVDFSVGNIKYSGDIEINGNVLPGFSVETDGNIVVRGEAESARIISRNGSVTIEKGIIGKNDMFVSAKKDVTIVFAQASKLVAEGSVIIGKFCLHCDIVCDKLQGETSASEVIGGSVLAYSAIEIGTTGNDKGIETKLDLVDKEEMSVRGRMTELKQLEEKLVAELEPIKKQLHTKAALLKQAGGQASGRSAEELKKWLDAYNKLSAKVKYVQEKIAEMEVELNKPRPNTGSIRILNQVYPGTALNLYGMTRIIKMPMANKVFRVKSGAIDTEG